jgi:5-formyltetrahydrofolate cyclo-ligase
MMPSEKQTLRKQMLALREGIDPDRRAEWNARIQKQLLASAAWRDAHVVMAYFSMPEEAATDQILRAALSEGKTLALPRCVPNASCFEAVVVRDIERDLEPGAFRKLLEPRSDLAPLPSATPPDLVLAPGVAFDRRGMRLGFGGGMYDRYLETHPEPQRIALAYSIQILDAVPTDPHDAPVHAILTEQGFFQIQA